MSSLPSWPQYWRAKPTEWLPFLEKPVSSIIQAPIGPECVIVGSTNSRTWLKTVDDEEELDEVYETERQVFYVACTRARDRLLIGA